ncbi:MAG: RNase P subunit p30 family protein, partial [Candidatus Heimdallarchaeaceae archaeon]
MQKDKDFTFRISSSSENFISLDQTSSVETFCEIANQMSVLLLCFENITISERNTMIKKIESHPYNVFSPSFVYEQLKNEQINNEKIREGFRKFLITEESKSIIIATRKTLSESSKDELMRALSKNRRQFEIISVNSDNKDLLKWVAHDRRLDYISIDLRGKPSNIDNALCSLVKQNGKCFEIILSPLLLSDTNKDFSSIVRTGKKIMKLILSHKAPFIFTMCPQTPLQMRSGRQLRYIGELLGV